MRDSAQCCEEFCAARSGGGVRNRPRAVRASLAWCLRLLTTAGGCETGEFGWMRERRLSERALAGGSAGSVALDTSMLLEDMVGYLRELFNVRHGSVPIRDDYGLPDFNDVVHQFPDAIDVLRAEIARQIQKFEPRFRDVTVRHIPAPSRPLSLLFRVNATIAVEGAGAVTVETEIGSDGLIKVAA
jgi:type VI secretion system protein